MIKMSGEHNIYSRNKTTFLFNSLGSVASRNVNRTTPNWFVNYKSRNNLPSKQGFKTGGKENSILL